MPPRIPPALARDLVAVCHRLYERGFVSATDGNVSARIDALHVACTPTALCKGDVRESDLVVIDMQGKVAAGSHRASTEMQMHLLYYARRPDVHAVVHAHPVHATAFATAGLPLTDCVFPEVIVTLGSIPLADYATPSTADVPASLEPFVATHDAVLLANHGVVTAGASLWNAYFRMEKVEHAAHTQLLASLLGRVRTLTQAEVGALRSVAGSSYGIDAASKPACTCAEETAPACGAHHPLENAATTEKIDAALRVRQALRELGFTID